MTTTTASAPATDKQLAFINKLIGEKNTAHFGEDTLADLETVKAGGTLPKKFASQLISALLAAPRKPKHQASGQALKPGIYQAPNGDLVKVQQSKNSSNVYALVMVNFSGERLTLTGEIVNWKWEYNPGLINHVTAAMKLDAQAAMDFGLKHGQCLWCHRKLEAAKSVLQSIGPVCAKKFM